MGRPKRLSPWDEVANEWLKIRFDDKKKKKLVDKSPELALRLYERFEDQTLGEQFVERYKWNINYRHNAYDISVSLNNPLWEKETRECAF